MIVNHLPKILRDCGWTPYRLAKETGKHYRVISRLVKSEKPSIGFDLLDCLCRVLKRQPGELFSYKRDAPGRQAAAKGAAKKRRAAPARPRTRRPGGKSS